MKTGTGITTARAVSRLNWVETLLESPDVFLGLWSRWNHRFLLFIGDEHGVLVSDVQEETGYTHAGFIRDLLAKGVLTKEPGRLVVDLEEAHRQNVEVLGEPKIADVRFSGAFLEPDETVPSVLSFWSHDAYVHLSDLLGSSFYPDLIEFPESGFADGDSNFVVIDQRVR